MYKQIKCKFKNTDTDWNVAHTTECTDHWSSNTNIIVTCIVTDFSGQRDVYKYRNRDAHKYRKRDVYKYRNRDAHKYRHIDVYKYRHIDVYKYRNRDMYK